MIGYLEYLALPWKIGAAIIGLFVIMQIIGELIEFKGKIVPEFFKIRKIFIRKRKEKEELIKTFNEVRDVLQHAATYNEWMTWVNNRAVFYDNSISKITDSFNEMAQALKDNTKLTEEMFVQSSRDRIIDFSYKAADDKIPVSREEYNRIFKVYDRYEGFLNEHSMTNGEIDIVYGIIKDSYEQRMLHHNFTEDVRNSF